MSVRNEGLSYLMDLFIGSSAGAVLASAIDLNVIPLLSGYPEGLTACELADGLGLDQRSTIQFLTTLACLGLVVTDNSRYLASELSTAHLLPGADDYIGGYIEFTRDRAWEGWGRLTDHLRGTARPVGWNTDQDTLYVPDDEALRGFWSGLHPLSKAAGRALPDLLGLSGQHRVLDVGGGTGGVAIGLCESVSEASATVYELPFVADIARSYIGQANLSHKVDTFVGDFFVDDFPCGYDTILLVNVLHNWVPEQCADLLASCHKALTPGGMVCVAEHMISATDTGSVTSALVGLLMMLETAGGRTYTTGDHVTALEVAGFEDVTVLPFARQAIASHVVTGRRR